MGGQGGAVFGLFRLTAVNGVDVHGRGTRAIGDHRHFGAPCSHGGVKRGFKLL